MIYEQARVVQVNDDCAIIEVINDSSCHGCEYNGACGTGSLGRLLGFRAQPLSILNSKNFRVGDQVMVQLPEQALMISGFLVYLLPLILMFLFALLANQLMGIDWVNVLAAMAGLFAGLYLASRLSKSQFARTLQPKVLHKIG